MGADQGTSDEPLGIWRGHEAALATAPDLRVEAFEYSSRGDRVPGRLLLPAEGHGPYPVVLLQHGTGDAKDAPYMAEVAAPWVRAGAAVASIDFPLHGARSSAKLSALLLASLHSDEAPAGGRALLEEFHRQAVADLGRALDVVGRLPELDGERVAYAGLSLGAIVGATFCGHDPRPRAAALALGGGGYGGADDPTEHVGRFAPRPILFVNARRDEAVPAARAEALHAAAGEPKEVLWFDCGHEALPDRAFKAMWGFLEKHL